MFERIAVIGAGTMGAGIAGQIANAGHEVLLLDLTDELARAGVDRLLGSEPPALVEKSAAARIETGALDERIEGLADRDWIVEAIVERLDVKRELYRRLDAVIGPDCVVTSNTSTIPIRLLVEGLPEAFRRRFAITHWFNPVRYMRLLELVRGEATDPRRPSSGWPTTTTGRSARASCAATTRRAFSATGSGCSRCRSASTRRAAPAFPSRSPTP